MERSSGMGRARRRANSDPPDPGAVVDIFQLLSSDPTTVSTEHEDGKETQSRPPKATKARRVMLLALIVSQLMGAVGCWDVVAGIVGDWRVLTGAGGTKEKDCGR